MRGRLRRLAREEGGFTLSEVMVSCLILIIVLFALYGIFDMTVRVYSIGNDDVEATANARATLERMEREVRMAFPMNTTNGYDTIICHAGNPQGCTNAANSTSITFGNDLNGDRNVANCTGTACSTVTGYDVNELITFTYNTGTRTLNRAHNTTASATGTQQIMGRLGQGGTMRFTYLGDDGADADLNPDCIAGTSTTALPCPATALTSATQEALVKTIRMSVTFQVDRGTGDGSSQTLSTDVAIRSRAR